jgi:hypothetical protein
MISGENLLFHLPPFRDQKKPKHTLHLCLQAVKVRRFVISREMYSLGTFYSSKRHNGSVWFYLENSFFPPTGIYKNSTIYNNSSFCIKHKK